MIKGSVDCKEKTGDIQDSSLRSLKPKRRLFRRIRNVFLKHIPRMFGRGPSKLKEGERTKFQESECRGSRGRKLEGAEGRVDLT